MPDIPNFWGDGGPHAPVPVEATWQQFVRNVGAVVLADHLAAPAFHNADFHFPDAGVVAELKVLETEFRNADAWADGSRLERLHHELIEREPTWRPSLLGGDGRYPPWFVERFVRLFREPLGQVLKKANRQIRETKEHLGIATQTGVLFFVNDGFTRLEPNFVRDVLNDMLVHKFSSIDCLVYLTVNRYVSIRESENPVLLWLPSYSSRAPGSLVEFIDALGRKWFDFFEQLTGPFTSRKERPASEGDPLSGSRAIRLPGEPERD